MTCRQKEQEKHDADRLQAAFEQIDVDEHREKADKEHIIREPIIFFHHMLQNEVSDDDERQTCSVQQHPFHFTIDESDSHRADDGNGKCNEHDHVFSLHIFKSKCISVRHVVYSPSK